jgi:DNA-binding GntR family transcriptional regulator
MNSPTTFWWPGDANLGSPETLKSASSPVFIGVIRRLKQQQFVLSQRLIKGNLAAMIGVGRNSVQAALARLAPERSVEMHLYREASIRSLSLQDTRDVLEVAELRMSMPGGDAAHNAKHPPNTNELRSAPMELRSDGPLR